MGNVVRNILRPDNYAESYSNYIKAFNVE